MNGLLAFEDFLMEAHWIPIAIRSLKGSKLAKTNV